MVAERVYLIITGRVQGVCYRSIACQKATELQLAGYVKNRPDGSVELVAEGVATQLQELVKWCKKGPQGAIVTDVEVSWASSTGQFQGFEIKY
ncbi:MAG: acylphosphatase [Candidatus Omnitrophica bacterium]|nr:acylphosphatase [Candidatus Omnitrophota bacterium]